MNYLTELLAFFRWMEQQRLSPLLQAFWHYLMYFNNRAAIKGADGFWYWPVEFRVPNKLFQDALGLKNRQALWTQRQTLIRKQRVTYTPDAGNRASPPESVRSRRSYGHKPLQKADTGRNRI